MKHNCDIISDLLPLYMDNACSSASAQAVEEHLAECSVCSKMLEDMRKSESEINTEIIKERNEVLDKQAKFFKRRSVLAGSIIGGIFAIPILVCLIVNLATGAGLTWFFIVLAAMFIPASLTIVPLMVLEKKGLWTFGSFSASLVVLLGVICIYTGGSWFFMALTALMLAASLTAVPALVPKNKALVTLGAFTASLLLMLGVICICTGGSWFLIAAAPALFGLTIIFAPFAANAKPIAKLLKNNKGLAVVAAYTLTYILMMVCIGLSVRSDSFFSYAFAISLPGLAYMWAMFAVIRYVKLRKEFKAAICVFMSGVFFFFGDTIVNLLLGNGLRFPTAPFGSVTTAELFTDSVNWVMLIFGTIISAILTVIGLIKQKKENKTKE